MLQLATAAASSTKSRNIMRIVLATACMAVLLAPANSRGDVTLFGIQPFFESAAAGNGNFLPVLKILKTTI